MAVKRLHLMVCAGTGCVSNKSMEVKAALETEIEKHGLAAEVDVIPTGCNGFCGVGPILLVQPDGIFYQQLRPRDIPHLVEEHLLKGRPVQRHLYTPPGEKGTIPLMSDIPFFHAQVLIALRNRGMIDPEKIEDYIAREGYQAAAKALTTMSPQEVLDVVKASGLRGRGGGGFPTGIKWESTKRAPSENGTRWVICNADEGDPGAFMDRSIIEGDPHSVLEGMIIGAYAIGATRGFIYVRQEYPLALKRFMIALNQARESGLLGEDILGTGFSFDIEVHRGAGAFVCGESTALMASLEGNVGEPRAKYIHTVERGLWNMPSCLNNVETWANVPPIILHGAEWFTQLGTGDVSENPWGGSKGTKVFSLAGKINNTGLVEVPMGITLREIVFDIGGGIANGKRLKSVQTGGPSGGCLPEELLDLEVDFDTLTAAGSMMGSGGMLVMDEDDCMVDFARFYIDFLMAESCGKCTPCREGLRNMNMILQRICDGKGQEGDIELLEEISACMIDAALCALGTSAPNPVLSTIKYFREEYEEHIREGKCRAGVCKALITYKVDADKCSGCTLCARACPVNAITGETKKLHVIDPNVCDRCGACYDACTFDAIIRV
ncbi:NADH-quinone oxidoreductase subunit NuoF [Candidatus Sumerlaeota bacterium]|nr:NADH-quinone oxidoreductase subunit NuoF [Candidatus Sumerlaeota bacterium]